MKVIIYDTETIKGFFLLSCYIPETDTWEDFCINDTQNDLYKLLKFEEEYRDYYWVGYNNLSFDSQVLEFILRDSDNWFNLSNLQISERIWQFAQDTIDNSNHGVFPIYRESSLSTKQVDLFKINHYDNKNRMVSLKRLEFEMDFENIEEFSVDHRKIDFSEQEKVDLINYCHNDVKATYEFFKITTGETDHPLYKGNNQIQLRHDIQEEFGIDCLNYSNAKIGDEIIKKYYCEEKKISYSDLPKKGFFRKSIKLKHCIPSNISFKTPELQAFLKESKTIELNINEDFERSIQFYGQTYTFAKGGLHNVINGKIYESDEENDIIDIDVSGYYPADIINNSYYPYHLGKEFLVGYSKVYFKRIELKPLAKKDKKIKGIVAGLKEAGNCPYGKSSDMQSWLYDKQMTLATCITGEFSLLMLIEDCELNGISCIMANTDGATFIVPKNKGLIFKQIKEEWLKKTSIKLTYELEEVKYKKMVFSTVNDYLAIKEDGEVKLKGDFMKDFELHKNKSARICPIALEKYFVEGIPVEDTIKNHKKIFDFCIRAKASRDFHYEGLIKETGEKKVYNKLIRYYISNKGEKLLKIKNPECQTNAAPMSEVNAGEWLSTVCNYLPKSTKVEDCDINYDFYIEKAQKIIDKIEGVKRAKVNKNQLSLF